MRAELHLFKIIDAKLDILHSVTSTLIETFPLTILDSGSAFINQYFVPLGSPSAFCSVFSLVTGSALARFRFVLFLDFTLSSAVSYSIELPLMIEFTFVSSMADDGSLFRFLRVDGIVDHSKTCEIVRANAKK